MLLLLIVEFSRHISLKALLKMLDNWNSKERCDKCDNQLSHECYSHNVCWRKSILLWRTNVWLTAGCSHSCKSSTWASFTSTETTKVQPWHPAVKRNTSGLMQVFFFSFSSNEMGKIRNLPTCCSTAGRINLQLLPQNITPESNTNMLVERILTETDGEIHCVMLRNTRTLHHSLLMAPLLPVSSCVESVPQQQLD